MSYDIKINCIRGFSAQREVLLGFAAADLLCRLSFADILLEDKQEGYQRPINTRHSLDFRQYIRTPLSSTIPLTLNLRPTANESWRITENRPGTVYLEVDPSAGKVMAQVDCQHRLGYLNDVSVILPFMCFIGLSVEEEMEVFGVINSKAKGLSRSLLDYHTAQLAESLSEERPELYIALRLNNLEESPWFKRLKLGGKATAGLKRIVSLRMMQQAIGEFLKKTDILQTHTVDTAARTILDFWTAVRSVLPNQWEDHRHHMITKGIGLYSLMEIASDIFMEYRATNRDCSERVFAGALADFVDDIDWSTDGTFKGLGGKGGVTEAVEQLREIRRLAVRV